MNTNKAAYWIALGAVALGLNTEYRQGSFVALHRVAERADSMLCLVATRAERTLAVARVLVDVDKVPANGFLASADGSERAWEQAELASDQVQEQVRRDVRDQVEELRDKVRDEVRAQGELVRAQNEMRRADMRQILVRSRSQIRLARSVSQPEIIVCPKTGVRVVVNADDADTSSDIEVGDTF
jgi:hypothetical protein